MRKEPGFLALMQEPLVMTYLVGCMVSLGLLAMAELGRGTGEQILLTPVLLVLGVLGMFAHFGSAPLMVLLFVGIGEIYVDRSPLAYVPSQRQLLFGLVHPLDLLLTLSLLAYLISQFRLHALTANLFPRDPRERREPPRDKPVPYAYRRQLAQKRTPQTLVIGELVSLLLLPMLLTAAAVLVWWQLSTAPHVFGWPEWISRILIIIWSVFGLALLAGGALAYWRWQTWSTDEALLVLQDIYWRETRREQARQYRWLAWARRRGKYRQDQQPK
jgi:hypothetical protein